MLRDLVRRDSGLAVVRHTGVFGKKQPYEPTQRNNDGRELAEQFVSQQALEQVRLRFLGLAKGTHDPRALGDSSGIHRHLRGLLALDNVHKALRRIFADLAERQRYLVAQAEVATFDIELSIGNCMQPVRAHLPQRQAATDRKSTRLNSSHSQISYAVFCLKKKKYS